MTYFVTGGSRGLGRGVVLQAVEEGHAVGFGYVRDERAARAVVEEARRIRPEARCQSYQLDVRDPRQVEAVLDRFVDEFGSLEVVVNAAGVNRDNLAVSMSDEEWDEVLATNLSGPFYVCRQVLPVMLAQRRGCIVNISSIQYRGSSGQVNYAASKGGLNALTQSLAKEYGRRGVRANVVVPGFFDTDMTRETMPQRMKDFWAELCPMPGGRMGEVEELARAVTFLASDRASFINGEILNLTGGLNHSR